MKGGRLVKGGSDWDASGTDHDRYGNAWDDDDDSRAAGR